ncbi:hypothetical protein H7849_26070 [Alloacidobacterium dinghuense]|uniref:Uncharacterized protein n=1 Tax=Alloacidobacterium dinghuense TaxID=2763107 RepID=A0A7G8BIN0_9BACT|nr:hypothetical protein [Alloacidobacterium dinghuense]QNI32400.1 hypothetical protein H7849_26070 [Alloacidobacterium dinghuense]
MGSSYQLLKDCAPPEPLSGGNEYKLCVDGYLLNFKHAEAQAKEAAANANMTESADAAGHQEQFEQLKAAVVERHEVMRAQFSHVKDCFICSVAFGLTPAPKPKQDSASFGQFLVRFIGAAWPARMKAGAQRV